ncbi:protein tyrosine phosphatase CDC14 [Spathaspora passalidarum NRRL Y-27907]|uniref:Tyrosine-protein phosphatase CDC14 n=1 Tax=Spathaspora passalidarum (strain NRRL Y-27907 / 11-Y1) TaxID=619300 RepID=G3ATW9_SPAPN|nr:protein tyrosine phosphatase CDC14 [Spathaspora passalidarum NRRL Y-27907]EGW30344.1 protein tyrosine phosphatase CDC14 [Spathaspora passalidarum NRRL Y-27907]
MGKNIVDVPLIEFLKNRIYLGAFDYSPPNTKDLVYFTIEDSLPYNSFHLDFGPLNIAILYRFAVILHNILNEENNQGKAVVFYSSSCPKQRANAACLLCCYMVLIQSWSPHQVLQPIAQCDPPFQGFRDAGYSHADYEITIQDIVYAMWRAKERGMIDLTSFNLEEYEQYERVDQGDFNVISKDFIAFASPQQTKRNVINEPFRKVLSYFMENNVQLVVRLNSHLYDSQEFTKRNIRHIDMIFDDGTCPTLDYVQKFVGAAETIINQGGKIAVHCKAGLGRTGCLIGAHLIYTHGFTANECIAYMRMLRPGMVVGPQQHWLYLHQNDFRDWRHTMVLDNRPCDFIDGLYPLISYEEFKTRMKIEKKKLREQEANALTVNSSFSQMDSSFQTPIRRRKISGALTSKIQLAVPNDSPGQPRKYMEAAEEHETELINNSDDDDDDENVVMMQDIQSTPGKDGVTTSTPNQWKILRSISTNARRTNQPLSVTKTTTTTTTRTVSHTLSSSPAGSPSIRMPKARSSKNRVISANGIQSQTQVRVHSGGIRKVSGKKY